MYGRIKRRYLFELQRGMCVWCGCRCNLEGSPTLANSFTIDHIVPTALDGEGVRANLAGACRSCNLRRSLDMRMISGAALEQKYRTERELLNKHRDLAGPWKGSASPMTLEHLQSRPWAVHEVACWTAGSAFATAFCLECRTDLRAAAIGVRSYCSSRCRRRASRRRLRSRRVAESGQHLGSAPEAPTMLTDVIDLQRITFRIHHDQVNRWEYVVSCAIVLIAGLIAFTQVSRCSSESNTS